MKRSFRPSSTIFQLHNNEAAQLAGISANHIREAIKAGKLKARIIGKGYRIKRLDMDAYIKQL
jgi:excisionase family DNA binding protein